MRLFFGIKLDNLIKKNIENFINSLDIKNNQIKWTKLENMHLTLQFVGEVENNIKDKLIENTINSIEFSEFEMEFKNIGGFPLLTNPKIIWVGIEENKNILRNLHKNIRVNCLNIIKKIDTKPFNPHITLARIKQKLENSTIELLKKHKNKEFGKQKVKNFHLFSSELTRKGPIYKDLIEIKAISTK